MAQRGNENSPKFSSDLMVCPGLEPVMPDTQINILSTPPHCPGTIYCSPLLSCHCAPTQDNHLSSLIKLLISEMHFIAVPSGNMTPERKGPVPQSVSSLDRQADRQAGRQTCTHITYIISPVPSENYTQAATQY